MVGTLSSAVAVGSSLEKKGAVGGAPTLPTCPRWGPAGAASTEQKMLKMNERTHYVL